MWVGKSWVYDSKESADEGRNGADMPDYDCRVCDKGPEDRGASARIALEMRERKVCGSV